MKSKPARVCTVLGCARKYRCSGFCGPHYAAHRYAANPEPQRKKSRERRQEFPERHRAQSRKWRLANPTYEREKYRRDPEPKKAAARRYHAKKPKEHYLRTKNWKKNNPDKVLIWQLKQYGLDMDAYTALLAKQGGGCAICGTTSPGTGLKRLHVDHDHATDKVRGLLCSKHNLLLGHAQDDPSILRKAAAYLEGVA